MAKLSVVTPATRTPQARLVDDYLAESARLDIRVLDRFSVHLRDHGGKRGPLSEHSIWTCVKSVNASSAG